MYIVIVTCLLQKFFFFRNMSWNFQNKEIYKYLQQYTVGVKKLQV